MDKFQRNRIAIYPSDKLKEQIEEGSENEGRSKSNYICQVLNWFHNEHLVSLGLKSEGLKTNG